MNQSFQKYMTKIKEYWTSRTKKQKITILAVFLSIVIFSAAIVFFTTRTTMVPLYSNLSPAETGSIKKSLDEKGIKSEITDGGTTIKVPKEYVDQLKVELAAEGIPKTGNIDYSFFSQKAGLGMTENEFNVLKLDAMQTELANLIKGIDGIKDAKVMINLPEPGVFVSDKAEEASASIVLETEPGYQFRDDQIKALYHLVSKSVPNLPTDNIVIMNQNFEYFDLKNENSSPTATFASQQEIKKQIERDVQRQVQTMLGTLMGSDKVVVSVTADIDFTQEKREENIVEPVDKDNMEGIAISAQKIKETFTGNPDQAGGIVGTGKNDVTNYNEATKGSNGNYEKVEETVNNEVNRIRKKITESPYKIRDLGIQVMVEPPVPDDPSSLPQERVDDIKKILGTIVRTTIDKNEAGTKLTDQMIDDKVVVSVQPFNGKVKFSDQKSSVLPWWAYVIGGILLAIIGLLIFLFIREKKNQKLEEEFAKEEAVQPHVPDVNEEPDTESSMRRKQLEKLAKEKPEDFAKLLRTWIAED
ncbi:flagellar basal-body MS-ring/collar protein FliF [Bacillus methanolicus]|uniref:Flagellar M-ring protein n=1 Tax=Bacillus methanolicus (strain MGA3 / ATCC 53907) TaxID=796606 RepID=I3DZA9_BACMM|nr:flagellar basal-body MS-ring/collar protein FliF [Bacillus methanolicus]AIE59651.1 Flagellar M-ring protein [Bacillus methanolicus MGA3]EIJ79580.1 flagellar MS-ring protein [Bacillus methanolicus MGA3]